MANRFLLPRGVLLTALGLGEARLLVSTRQPGQVAAIASALIARIG